MAPPLLRLRTLPRLRQWRLVLALAQEAGINHMGRQAACSASLAWGWA
jgi:hypothetical protein